MADEMNMEQAQQVYQTICKALDARNWQYDTREEDLSVHLGINGDDLPMDFFLQVDTKRQILRLLSPMPFKMSEEKRIEGAVASAVANYGMVDGSFDYDLQDGMVVFRISSTLRGCTLGPEQIYYLIDCGCAMVDLYNDRFFALNKGFLTLEAFIEKSKR